MKYKRCEQKRNDCFGCVNGKCRVLNDTHFINPITRRQYKCPFYKQKQYVPYEMLVEIMKDDTEYGETDETAKVGV